MINKKLGVVMLVVGVIDAIAMYYIKNANQPVRVTSAWGSGYMTDGWGDALPMFNVLMVLGIIMAVVGLITVFAAKK